MLIEAPFISNQLTVKHEKVDDLSITNFINCPYFSVTTWELNGLTGLEQSKKCLLVSVIQDEGELIKEGEHYCFKKGDHFIIPNCFGRYDLVGNFICIV